MARKTATIAEKTETETVELTTTVTPHSALALLYADTAYRLQALVLRSENNIRAKENKPPLVPGMPGLRQGFGLISGFHTHFVETPLDEDGKPQWVNGNQTNLMPVYYRQMEDLTDKLLDHAAQLKGVDLKVTAMLIVNEREHHKAPPLPDASGPTLTSLVMPLANKVVFYASQLIVLLRNNGGKNEFAPKSSMTVDHVLKAMDAKFLAPKDLGEVDEIIDHPEMRDDVWDITGEILKPSDEFHLELVELEKAEGLQAAAKAWYDVYLRAADGDIGPLADEVKYTADLTAERVAQMRAQQQRPVGIVRS